MLARLNAVARESGIADRMILIDEFLSNDATALKRLYEKRDFAHLLGERARQFIAAYFSEEDIRRSLRTFVLR